MMDALLILRNIRVENANTIAGLTWGFPAVSHFLGFIHALSRKLPAGMELQLQGCGIICHSHEVLAHRPRFWSDYVFSLTRNPLTKSEESAPFIEEGRMHMNISLLIPCAGDLGDSASLDAAKEQIAKLALSQRLAGGLIIDIRDVELIGPPENREELRLFERRQLRKLLPGFALVQRSDVLGRHIRDCADKDPPVAPLDAWLDFSALKYRAEKPEGENEGQQVAQWNYVPKPAAGWLVPVAVGYRGISELYEPGEVARSRDSVTPFRFVESVYSIGEWISPHRVSQLEQLIWRYDAEPEEGWYLCSNSYQPDQNY